MEPLAKTYDPAAYEDHWYAHWRKQGFFRSKPDKRKAYTIVIPPPNVTGILHMGHMLNNTLQDVLIRRKRMEGYNACWVPGTDHASIATEAKVVRMLADQGIRKEDLGREGFLEKAMDWKTKYGGIILKQQEKLGASCDWDRTRFTMDPGYYAAVIDVFIDLYNKGLIYRGYRMVNWDPQAQTSLSDEEVLMKEKDGMLYHLRYPFAQDPSRHLTIATTRPETIFVDVAVAVNPEDARYTHLLGTEVCIPGTDTRIPIIADSYVDMAFGTGCLKVTPAHDINDYQIGLRHHLPIKDVLNPDGTLNAHAGKYAGMDRFAARKAVVRDLKALELVAKEEPIKHNVGHSERTDAIIEPRLTHQWFLNMKAMAQVALQAVESGEVTLIPDRYLNTYRHWLENVQDWNISRQLWWGQQIPAWFFESAQGTQHVVAHTRDQALPLAQAMGYTGPADGLTQDPDVLDTWFSSWLWPMAVFDPTVFRQQADGTYPAANADLRYYYPTNDLVTAPEILFFWVARMIMAGKTWDAQGRAPFRNVYLTGIVRDKQRRKMSKSLGNSPDPLDLIRDYGADSVRVGMLLCAPAGNDILFDMALVEQGRNFCNKLWNSFRLLKTLEASQDAGRKANTIESQAMRWMQARISEVSRELTHLYSQFRISEALMAVYKLVWDDFCSWYLEMIKPSAGGSISAHAMEDTRVLFEEILKLLHPFTPFITEELWHQLRPRAPKDSLMIAQLREPAVIDTDAATLAEMQEVRELITAIRALRAENGLGGKELLALQVHSQAPLLFDRYGGLICRFAALSDIVLVTDRQEGMATTLVRAHTLYLPKGAVDADEARAKLQEEIAYTEGFLKSVGQKLGNEKFVANAKPEVVANERKKQADAEAKLAALQQQLASLG